MKKIILIILIAFIAVTAHAAGVYLPVQGGTGIGSATAGDVNKCLIVSNNAPFTYTLGTCGSGGGSGGGTWSTTTSNVGGRLINYPNNNTDIVNIGSQSTATGKFWFDPNISRSWLQYASTTGLTVTGASYIPKLSNLTGNGFVKTSGSDGTLSIDTNSYLTGTGAGVTSVSVASANGFAGSSSGGATPALTLSTSITGLLKGNGTAISAAANGTDYTLITAKTCTAGDFVSSVTAGGVFTCTTPSGTTYTATYPVTLTGSAFGLAFGTTTSNTWAGTQSFTNTANFNTWTNNGSASTTNLAITGLTGLLVGNGSTKPVSVAVSGTDLKTVNSTSIIGSGDIAVQPTLVSGTNIKTINGSSILGSGDLTVTGGSGLSSSTPWTIGNVTYVTGNSTLGSTATGTVSSGTGISVTAGQSIIGSGLTITNTAPDQTVAFTNGTGISVTGTYPNFTVTNTGSTFAFPWTVNSGYNATSTVIGFTGGLFSTASSTFSSALRLSSLSQGSLYVGSTGLVNSVATSAPTVTAPITYSGTLGAFVGGTGGAFDCTSANGSTKGCITSTDWTTFNNKQATIGVTFPITLSGATVGFGGLSTSSAPTIGQMPYWTGVNTFGSVATTTATCSGTVSCSTFTILGSTPITLTGSASGGTGNVSTSTNETNGQLSYWTTTSGTPAKLGSVATTTLTATAPIALSQPISVIGSTPSVLTCADANTSTKGCVTSTDWNTFNNKLGSYDAFTHPAVGYSATTSAIQISSTATSTFAGGLSVGTTSATTLASATFTVKGLMDKVMQIFTSAGTKMMEITNAGVATLLGTWDYTGAILEIPFSTDPTVNANGSIAINSTTASSSLRYYDGTAERALYDTFDKPTIYASSTLAYDGAYSGSATTTYSSVWNPSHAVSLVSIYCKTDVGTVWYEVGTGSASSTVLCTSSGAVSNTAVSFTLRQSVMEALGKQSTNPNRITVTPTFRYTAD